jgi:hypothetical protein
MATAGKVLAMLRPQGGWITTGEEYSGVQFLECEPITEAEFSAGFAQYDAWKAEQDAAEIAKKAAAVAKLTALGLTADDLKALGLGSN